MLRDPVSHPAPRRRPPVEPCGPRRAPVRPGGRLRRQGRGAPPVDPALVAPVTHGARRRHHDVSALSLGIAAPQVSSAESAARQSRGAGTTGDAVVVQAHQPHRGGRRLALRHSTTRRSSTMATDLIDLAGHEQVAFCSDPETGLRAIIALHDTALGPGLGGTRFHPYASMDQALADVLRLSRAMTSKNAVAGLDHGGGKAVIIGDPHRDKTPELLRAYGRFVESLGGRYVTACDVGTYVADMDVVGESTRWATGRSPERGGAGDSSVLTAYGVFQGMRAAAQHVWGEPSLAGRRVGDRRRRQGGPAPHRPPPRGRRRGRRHRRRHRMPCAPCCERHPAGAGGRRPRRPGAPRRSTCSARTRSAGALDDDDRRGAARPGRLRGRQQPAGQRGRAAAPPTGCWPAASPTPRTSSSTPAASSRSATSCTGSTCERARGAHGDDLRAHPRGAARRRRGRREPRRGRRPARRAPDRRRWATPLAARRPGRRARSLRPPWTSAGNTATRAHR